MRFVVRVVGNAFAIWVVTLLPALRVHVVPFGTGDALQVVLTLLAVGAIFAVVNSVLGFFLRLIAFPLYILTLGLISLVINGILLEVTAWLTSGWGWGLRVESFWWGVLAALLIAIINGLIGTGRRRRRAGGR